MTKSIWVILLGAFLNLNFSIAGYAMGDERETFFTSTSSSSCSFSHRLTQAEIDYLLTLTSNPSKTPDFKDPLSSIVSLEDPKYAVSRKGFLLNTHENRKTFFKDLNSFFSYAFKWHCLE